MCISRGPRPCGCLVSFPCVHPNPLRLSQVIHLLLSRGFKILLLKETLVSVIKSILARESIDPARRFVVCCFGRRYHLLLVCVSLGKPEEGEALRLSEVKEEASTKHAQAASPGLPPGMRKRPALGSPEPLRASITDMPSFPCHPSVTPVTAA